MDFIISYTMDGGAGHEKVVSGNSEVEARAAFAHEMKPQKYIITGIEVSKDDRKEKTPENRERTTENKEEKTTLEKLDDDEDDRVSKK